MFNAYTVLTRILVGVVIILLIAIGIKEYDIMQIPSRTLKLTRALDYYVCNLTAKASLNNFYCADDDIVYANVRLSSNEREELKKLEEKLLDIGFSEKKPYTPMNYLKLGIFSEDGTEKYLFISKDRIGQPSLPNKYLIYSMAFEGARCSISERILCDSNLLIEIKPVYSNIRIELRKKLEETKREEWISKFVSSLQLSPTSESKYAFGMENGIYDMEEMKTISEKRITDTKERIKQRQEREKAITKHKAFYSGHWVGTYTEEGQESKKLSIDMLRTYTDATQEPHLQGILRLAYGTVAKVNLIGKLWEDGKVQLLDSNYIRWEASPYYDGSQKVAGTFKGKMNGKYFKGKWFAEKREEQKYFSILSPKEERKSIEGFIIGEWLSDWYGNTASNLTKFNTDGSFRVENSAKPSEAKVGTWNIIDSKSFELSLEGERILYKINSIDSKNFVFKAENKNWVPWKGIRKN